MFMLSCSASQWHNTYKHTGPHSDEVKNIRKTSILEQKVATHTRFEKSPQSHPVTGLCVIPPRLPWGSDVTITPKTSPKPRKSLYKASFTIVTAAATTNSCNKLPKEHSHNGMNMLIPRQSFSEAPIRTDFSPIPGKIGSILQPVAFLTRIGNSAFHSRLG